MSDAFLDMRRSELKCHFEAVGRFYVLSGLGATYPCRDLLEIRRLRVSLRSECDAAFIMMNPGSSEPLEELAPVALGEAALVPTEPDITQYQLMRLMGVQGWHRVKVLNLSDLRVRQSKDFYQQAREFDEKEGHDGHSIFSTSRRSELSSALSRRAGAPLVAAWGVDRALKPLAEKALTALRGTQILGLSHPNRAWAYRHPLPPKASAQERWRREAWEMLRASW